MKLFFRQRPIDGKILIDPGIQIGTGIIDQQNPVRINLYIHKFQNLPYGIVAQHLNVIPVLYLIIAGLQCTVYTGKFRQLHLLLVDVNDQTAAVFRQRTDLRMGIFSPGRLLYHDLIIGLDLRIHIGRLTIDGNNCRLTGHPPYDARLSAHGNVQFLSAFREQGIIGQSCMHSRIHYRQLGIVIQLDTLSIEMHINKAVCLQIIGQTDTDRCNQQRILVDSLLQEIHLLHYLLAAECHSLLLDFQLLCQSLGIFRYFSSASDDKDRTDRFAAV